MNFPESVVVTLSPFSKYLKKYTLPKYKLSGPLFPVEEFELSVPLFATEVLDEAAPFPRKIENAKK